VIAQRARMQQRPSSATAPPFLHVRPRALWLECKPVEKKNGPPHPGRVWQRERATWHVAVFMPAARKEAI
jgi:hypothetical protein